ncbi:MAG TPA: cytochrome c oxidase subunit 3 [Bacillales bacterium]|nr:cytochrome c oxidase subunit 3 [Bacillales bacterium]
MAHHAPTLPPNPERATLEGKNKFLGFWFFLGGETVLFACLFGTYLGLTRHFSDPNLTPDKLFELPGIFAATLALLFSSLTSVFAVINMKNYNMKWMQIWFWVTILLGWIFNALEASEFYGYVTDEGFTYGADAFSSAFYTLLGFHGGHVFFGTLWILTLILQTLKKGINTTTAPKLYIASLYWHFVDVVWVFIFTVVYLMGKVG